MHFLYTKNKRRFDILLFECISDFKKINNQNCLKKRFYLLIPNKSEKALYIVNAMATSNETFTNRGTKPL